MHKAKSATLLMEYQVSATVALPLLALLYRSFVCLLAEMRSQTTQSVA
jgi:hypothetical protein